MFKSNGFACGVSVVALIFVLLACGASPQNETPRSKPSVDVPNLVGKSSKQIETVLGPAVKVVAIPDGPDSPGEYRDYRILDNRYILSIRFLRDKPAIFICDFTPPFKSSDPAEIAALFGFSVAGKRSSRIGSSPYDVTYWSGEFAGTSFQDVRITRDTNDSFGEFRAKPAN